MKKWKILLMFLLMIVTIRRVDYIPILNNSRRGYKQGVRIIFAEGSMLILKKNIINDFIPYGKVEMRKVDSARYIFIKVEEDKK